jgi:nitronate monooxygenase
VLRNLTFERWEAAGCPPVGKRPGEGDVIATNTITGATKRRYSVFSPGVGDQGALSELVLYAGEGVEAIPSAGEVVVRLWKECLDA